MNQLRIYLSISHWRRYAAKEMKDIAKLTSYKKHIVLCLCSRLTRVEDYLFI